ncbi:MAG: peptidylprolyl isomerase [Flavobacteriales bacterium]
MNKLSIAISGCAIAVILCASQCNNDSHQTGSSRPGTAETKPQTTPTEAPAMQPEQPATTTVQAETPAAGTRIKITTPYGSMTAVLYDDTPLHRANFLKLVDQKYYDGLLWHRCMKGFMVQGGDPDSRNAPPGKSLGMGGPGYKVKAEFNAKHVHKKGALAAARSGAGNPERESSGSQFYIVQGKPMTDAEIAQTEMMVGTRSPGFKYTDAQKLAYKTIGGSGWLDMDYTVFGEVTEGFNVIDSLAAQPVDAAHRPFKDITMKIERMK